MNFELESDMKAAKMLDLHPAQGWKDGTKSDNPKATFATVDGHRFTLSDPATRDAVVQMLLNKGIYIRKISGVFEWVNDNNKLMASGFDEYIEVVRHAVMEVKDE